MAGKAVILLLAVLALGGADAPAANGIEGSPFAARLASEFAVPLPPAAVVHRELCPVEPGDPVTACSDRSTNEIWIEIGAMSRLKLAHELGHLHDAQVLTRGDRKRFRRFFRWAGLRLSRTWWRPPWERGVSPAEIYAEAYSACAVGLRDYAIGYGYDPTLRARLHRRICNSIRRQRPAENDEAPPGPVTGAEGA